MRKVLILTLMAAAVLAGCNKKSSTATASDPVERKLQQLAGSDAANCGHMPGTSDQLGKASECAMQAAQAKKPFYVAYDLGGEDMKLTVGVAGSGDGKLYALEYNPKGWQDAQGRELSDNNQIASSPCPAALRVAQSGRVTCYPPGAGMGMMGGMGGGNPHGGMMMPPTGGENPHGGGMTMPPAGTPNPHGGAPADKPATSR